MPSLTTIRQERTQIGLPASKLLLKTLADGAKGTKGTVEMIDVALKARGSSAPLAQRLAGAPQGAAAKRGAPLANP